MTVHDAKDMLRRADRAMKVAREVAASYQADRDAKIAEAAAAERCTQEKLAAIAAIDAREKATKAAESAAAEAKRLDGERAALFGLTRAEAAAEAKLRGLVPRAVKKKQ